MADIFISYAQADRDLVDNLAKTFEAKRYSVWWDDRLRAGQIFDDAIRNELMQAKAVLVVWTPASVKSEYVRMETGIAFAWDKLVPVRASDLNVAEIPKAFQKLQTPDLSDLDRIVEAIEEKRGKKLTLDEIVQSAASKTGLAAADLKAWLTRCRQEGLRVVVRRSIMVKGAVPDFGEVNLCTLYQDGTFNTNYIAESAERIGAPWIADDYLKGVATLIDGATVRTDNKRWAWRVDLYGALPDISKILPRGEEWIALMKVTQESFIKAAAQRTTD